MKRLTMIEFSFSFAIVRAVVLVICMYSSPTLAVISSETTTSSEVLYDVIIIGAGWAGIGAANTLRDNGIDNYCVLEARDYIGGRSYTSFAFGEDIPMDLGTYYVPGTTNNPVFNVLSQTDISRTVLNFTPEVISLDGTKYDGGSYQKGSDVYWNDFYRGYHALQQGVVSRVDQPLEYVINDFVEGRDELDNETRGLFDAFRGFYIEADYSGTPNDMSLWYWDTDEYYVGDYHFISNSDGGFQRLIGHYAEPIRSKIWLNSKVTAVNYTGYPVEVTYVDANGKDTTLKTKRVLSTLPVGVLQAGTVTFTPEFSSTQKSRIDDIGAGKALVVAFYWEESLLPDGVFWDEKSQFQLFVAPEPSQHMNFTYWVNFYAINGNVPILAGTVFGDRCDGYVGRSDAEISDVALAQLRLRFGSDRVPDPSRYVVKNWATDEFALGAYSYARVGIERRGRERAGSSIGDDLVFFAGEAFSSDYPGSANGALESGQARANDLVRSLRTSRPSAPPTVTQHPTHPTVSPSVEPSLDTRFTTTWPSTVPSSEKHERPLVLWVLVGVATFFLLAFFGRLLFKRNVAVNDLEDCDV